MQYRKITLTKHLSNQTYLVGVKRRTVLASIGAASIACAGCSTFDDPPDIEIEGEILQFEAADLNDDGKLAENVNRNEDGALGQYDSWKIEIELTITKSDTDEADFDVQMLGPILVEEVWGQDVSSGTSKTFRRTERNNIKDRIIERVNADLSSDSTDDEVTKAFKNALSGEEISLTYPIDDAENTTIATYKYPY